MIGLVPAEKLADYVGKEIGSSEWFQVDQDRIDQFADATLDHQFIHVDSEKATPLFGSTIAHGFLSLSLIRYKTDLIKIISFPYSKFLKYDKKCLLTTMDITKT